MALVIGNGSYRQPLHNALNDAADIAKALRQLDFEVLHREDLTLRQMEDAVRKFGDALIGASVGLFYYAGHGVQVGGINYLLPLRADIQREDELKYQALSADLVLDKMRAADSRTNVVILDACRDNPFQRSRALAGLGGLAPMSAPHGTVIAYATGPNSVASDGVDGRNGLFTAHLLQIMRRPGVPIEQVFKEVRRRVHKDSGGRQTPWETSSLQGDFYFVPAAAQVPEPRPTQTLMGPPPVAATSDVAAPQSSKTPNTPQDALQLALARYKLGQYQEAIAYARRGTPADPGQAWSLIGMAACKLNNLQLIGEAHRHLNHAGQEAVLRTCSFEKKRRAQALCADTEGPSVDEEPLPPMKPPQSLGELEERAPRALTPVWSELHKDNHRQVISMALEHTAAYPSDAWLLIGLASCHLGDHGRQLQAADRLDGITLGLFLSACKRIAIKRLQKVDSEARVLLSAAWAQMDQLNFREAIALAQKQIATNPRHSWLLIGRAACRLHDQTLAEQAFEKLQLIDQLVLSNTCRRDDITLPF